MSALFPMPPLKPRKPPLVQLPKTLVTFSYDESHDLHIGSNMSLRYFSAPPPGTDLNYGYERWIKRDEERGRLDSLLKCLTEGGDAALQAAHRPSTVTWRGVITKILIAPYERYEGWTLNAMMVDGMIFIEEHMTLEQVRAKQDLDPDHRRMTYYGYSFESFCTKSTSDTDTQTTGTPPGWSGDVNTNVQHCHVVKSKLGEARLIMGGEVDCARGRYTGETSCLMELKTSMMIQSKKQETNFERKLLKFWAQSYLLGIPEIFVGFRTREGTIKSTQSFETLKIPSLVRGKGDHAWDTGVCLDFAERFLVYLRELLGHSTSKPSNVWRLTFTPGIGIRVIQLTEGPDLEYVRGGEDRVGFLPREFFEARLTEAR